MIDIKQYLMVLTEGLKKKNRLLTGLVELNKKQADVIKQNGKLEEFDHIVEEKTVLIDEINRVDNGFQTVYNRVSRELEANKQIYKDEIHTLQELIRKMTHLGIEIEAGEARNKMAIEQYFSYLHKDIHSTKRSLKAANDYYKSMSGANFNDPRILDQKK